MNGYVIYNNYVRWMGMLYILIMYDEWVCYIIINYVWWMGMLYRIIMYDEWVCYI